MHPKVWKRDFPAKKEDKMRHTAVLLLLFGAICCYADTIYVDDDGPADFNNIQDAIDFAVYGDTIQVAEGTYAADITLKNGVALIGQDPNNTIIDGNDKEIGITSENCDSNTVLEGFTITKGFCFGMRNRYSSPRVHNCTFSNNHVEREGGGMYNYESSLIVTDCNFIDNDGGGMLNEYSSPIIINCTFSGNHARNGGGILNVNSNSTIMDCNFKNNLAHDGAGMNNYSGSKPNVINCVFSDNSAQNGGGMFNSDDSEPNVINCVFSGNSAYDDGGGMYNFESDPIVHNCSFYNNSVVAEYAHGGGMYNFESDPIVHNCSFYNNSAVDRYARGGGMYNFESDPIVHNCLFYNNSAAAWLAYGGGMYNNDGSKPMVTNCTFNNNSAFYGGGGMFNRRESSPTVTNCAFSRNTARNGGGMYNSDNNSTVTNCAFIGNTVIDRWGHGGGMYNRESDSVVTNCAFIGNSATGEHGRGGGMYNSDNNSTVTNCAFIDNSATGESGQGGGISNEFGYLMVTNCTFSDNSANESGGGMANLGRNYPTVTNSIFRANTADSSPQIYDSSDSLIITYSDIEGGWEGEGNIDADPCFAEPGYWADVNDPNIAVEPNDPNAIWIDGDYHLQSQGGRWDENSQSWVVDSNTSPCIDAGDWMSPVGFEPFPNGGRVNMGAYGGTAEASKSYFGDQPCETIIAGDINGDCIVNFIDFAIMSIHWLEDARP